MMAWYRSLGLILFGLLMASNASAGASVVPGGMTPNDLAWLAEATGTTVSGSLDALLSKPVNGTLTTAKGAKIPLPANWSAAIPRATVAQAAGKLLVRATPVGLAGLALYQLLHTNIGMNTDGTVSGYSMPAVSEVCGGGTENPTAVWSRAAATGSLQSVAAAWAAAGTAHDALCWPTHHALWTVQTCSGSSCSVKITSSCCGTTYTSYSPVAGATYTPSESDLGAAIQNSPAATGEIAQDVIKDAKTANIDFGGLGFLTPVQPTTITASPVVAGEETIATEIIPNADDTTSTRTTKLQTTATPKVTGTTVGDQALEWETSDKQTRTTTNNATGVTTTETTTTSYGTSTTQQKPDYGTFAGTDPGDGFTDGRNKVKTALCGGNCNQSFNCAAGTCSVSERMATLRTKYSLAPTASGTCPAITMDLSAVGYGSHSSTEHCDLMESVRVQVGIIMSIMIALGVFTIILGA
ncbi:hypothetical protein BJL95_21345 [Methylomonas sp. LWB]|uniref:hypothetical protein n=1 Tax=Methylomonas sp. LWB TaxID=1905845 RepID=UPI0008DA7299|nr:hypothetical protein [Methylomonas sp. LWB]OHX37214.1 hypothetical protein BJL95_21345 [Methylomonas sp. LWB]